VLVMDQFRADFLERFRPYFGHDGFNRLLKQGAVMTNARYTYGTTYTGPGHALILSGTYGHNNGIIGNRWYNRESKQIESMFYDPQAKLLGANTTPNKNDTSPRNFVGSNLSDSLKISHRDAKVVGLSLKDRAAIALAGKLGQAFWFNDSIGGMLTSSYYPAGLPTWINDWNAQKRPDQAAEKNWDRVLKESAYALQGDDDVASETDFQGLGKTFPHKLHDAKPGENKSGAAHSEAFYEAFTCTPFSLDYLFDLARTALEKEQMGRDDVTDLLGISVTTTDIVGHSYGPDSHEAMDTVVRLDGQVAGLLQYLDKHYKPGEVLFVLTADHGAAPMPELSMKLGIEGYRIKKKQIKDAVEARLTEKFGAGPWVIALEDPGIFLDRDLIASKKLDLQQVEWEAGQAALTLKGMAEFWTSEDLVHGRIPHDRDTPFFVKSYFPSRSGDVILSTRPYSFWGTYAERDTGSTHGSSCEYDTHVPLIVMGSQVRPGHYNFNVDMADLAPTLATILHIPAPAATEGRTLHEILP